MKKIALKVYMILLLFSVSFSFSQAACDCGSTDSTNPCTGQSISVTVKAGTPNGGKADDSIYNYTFNSGGDDAKCGQFANGDYWIAPATGQSAVTVNSITTTSPGPISADIDVIPESMGLLSGVRNYGNYNAAENIIPLLPQSYSGINSILTAIQRDEITANLYDGNQAECLQEGYNYNADLNDCNNNCGTAAIVGECVDSYNVLTILSSVPENAGVDMIRPNITGESKELLRFSDFDFSRVPSQNFLIGPTSEILEDMRVRWSHSTEIFGIFNSTRARGWSEGGRAFRSHALIDDYGAGAGVAFSNDLMRLFSDDISLDEKKQALAALLTYGHDIFKAVYDPPPGVIRWFGVGASQSAGRFPPAVLFASLAIDEKYKNLIKTAGINGQDLASVGPHELTQIHPGKLRPVWGDVSFGEKEMDAYWGGLFKYQCYDGATGPCITSAGQRTGRDPHGYIDGPPNKPGIAYLASSLGPERFLLALNILMPESAEIVNYPNLETYVKRMHYQGLLTADDPCVTPDTRENLEVCAPYESESSCQYYKVTWGPDPNNPGDCIKIPTPPYTKVGRFMELDGNIIGVGYGTNQVEANWDTIMSLSDENNLSRADVDNSGEITTADALLTLRKSLGISMSGTAWQASSTTGDVNCDNVSNSADALLILRHSLGLGMEETSWCG